MHWIISLLAYYCRGEINVLKINILPKLTRCFVVLSFLKLAPEIAENSTFLALKSNFSSDLGCATSHPKGTVSLVVYTKCWTFRTILEGSRALFLGQIWPKNSQNSQIHPKMGFRWNFWYSQSKLAYILVSSMRLTFRAKKNTFQV